LCECDVCVCSLSLCCVCVVCVVCVNVVCVVCMLCVCVLCEKAREGGFPPDVRFQL